MTVLTAQTALIVVDLQDGTAAYQHAHPVEKVAGNVEQIAAAVRAAGGHVSFIWHDPALTPAGATQHGGGPRAAAPDYATPLLQPAAGDGTLTRGGWSAFTGTALHQQLQQSDIDTVIIVGHATAYGVESTARSAYDLGYNVVLVEDATNNPDPAAHTERFTAVFPGLAVCVSTEALLNSRGA
ncbi:cysteine hydrolase [Curtobacterium luteum]|uniref:cysteine hydrolase n=1 Tax=Curtobacterium luteum TaxID=33881 RepID=UPI00382150BA